MEYADGPRKAAHRISRPVGAFGVSAFWLLALASLLFGGGTKNDLFSDLALQFFAIVVLIYALSRLQLANLQLMQRQAFWVACAVAFVPIAQTIPMPYFFWSGLPGRSEIFAGQSMAGAHAFWRPFSLEPSATLAGFRALLPSLAILALGLQLSARQLRQLGLLVVMAALLMVPVGIAQVAGGPHSPLRPYSPTNPHDAVGLFANRNHYAALMVVGLVLVMTYARAPLVPFRRSIELHLWIGACLVAGSILLLGIVLSRSRAGFVLAGLAIVAVMMMVFIQRREQRAQWRWLLGFSSLASLLAFQFGFLAIADRLRTFTGEDLRWNIAPVSLDLAAHYGLLGTGIGSYPAAFAAYEPLDRVTSLYVNHAHNDYLELLVEVGILYLLVLSSFALWLWRTAMSVEWRRYQPKQVFRAGVLVALLILLIHSFFDYPLRTTTLSVVFAWAAALLAAPDGVDEPSSRTAV